MTTRFEEAWRNMIEAMNAIIHHPDYPKYAALAEQAKSDRDHAAAFERGPRITLQPAELTVEKADGT